MVRPHPLKLLEERHSTAILLFLYKHQVPVITKSIMSAIEVRNWATIASTLSKLEEAGLVTHIETKIGKYASKAQLWRLEPKFGVKVAATLEEVEGYIIDAASRA